MTKVLPAIIPINKAQLEEEISKVSYFAPLIQVDISDGIFTGVRTWPYNGRDTDYFEKLKLEADGWPKWEETDIELHLMVKNPEEVVGDWITTGVATIVAHIESTEDFQKVIDLCREKNVSVGVAIKPSTDISKMEGIVEQVDFIQVMGSDNLGRHGVELEEVALEKIKMLREKYPEKEIALDIGVTEENKEEIISAGATKLISGGAILESDNPKEVFEYLSE
jgi:ribulose-phosphate 3-epimerase